MKVRYSYEMSYPYPPGRDSGEVILDTDDLDSLPPLLRRDLQSGPIEGMFDDLRVWEFLGGTVWYWVRPL